MSIKDDALSFVKENQKELVDKICDLSKYPPSQKPFTLFMAGSPGSGKTEYSKNLLKYLEEKDPHQKIVRLDTDELRDILPQYTGENSDEVQQAATTLFDKVFDCIHQKKLNAMVDTTFASPRAIENVRRALGRGRKVGILYLYQNPLLAWEYTKKREKLEGRVVPKKVFIDAYFAAKENVNKVKEEFGSEVELNLFEKDRENNFVNKARFNIQTLDEFLKEDFTREMLEKMLPNEL